ncbi:MAG: TRAP transporter large permease [Synergistaceae bacterium]|jgi:C4-dicarboxylate transporter DctM subunit|nr:TRAP transporter large permease [Synergistaceae bacterium]
MSLLIFIGFFLFTLAAGMPIAVALALTGVGMAVSTGSFRPVMLGHVMLQGVDSFSLLAVPFFMLAGGLMEEGGISRRLMDFAFALVGRMKGGLAQVAIVLSVLFAGLSGSAVADTAAVGSMLIPSMKEKGYRHGFCAALVAAGGALGPVIPPSIAMIVYAVAANASVEKLFIGGILPGVAFGVLLMIYSHIEAVRYNYPRETGNFSSKELFKAMRGGFLALLLPVVILGGIRFGFFTATESSAIAVIYALFLGKFVYGELKWSRLPTIFANAARGTSAVMLIIAVASFLSWVLTSLQIPQTLTRELLAFSKTPTVILLLINAFVLLLGCFIDAVSIIVLITPVAIPLIGSLGIDPVYFGLLLVLNVCIGALTPPVGTCLFVASSVGRISLGETAKSALPIVLIATVGLVILILFPGILMFLPNLGQ